MPGDAAKNVDNDIGNVFAILVAGDLRISAEQSRYHFIRLKQAHFVRVELGESARAGKAACLTSNSKAASCSAIAWSHSLTRMPARGSPR